MNEDRVLIASNVRITREMFARATGEDDVRVLAEGVRECVERGVLRWRGDDRWDVFMFTDAELDEINAMLAGQVGA